MISRTLRLAHRLLRIAGLEERIQFYAKNHKISEEELRRLAKADPTGGKYLGWIIRNVVDPGGNSADEWFGRVRQALAFFQKVSKSPALLEHVGLPADINKLTLDELYDSWITHKDEDLKSKAQETKKAKETVKVIYNNGPYKILQIGGEGVDPETAVEAVCSYSQGTAWCTRSENTAKSYLQRGRLFLAFKGKERLFLADYRGSEIKDVSNEMVKLSDETLMLLLKSGILQFWADKAYPSEKEDKIFDYCIYHLRIHPHKYPVFFQHLIDNRLVSTERLSRYIGIGGGALPQAEDYIATDPRAAFLYSVYAIDRPWPKGEPAIRSVPKYWQEYRKYFKEKLVHA
jgi:hypothetical protein